MFMHSGDVQSLSGSGILSWSVVFTDVVHQRFGSASPASGIGPDLWLPERLGRPFPRSVLLFFFFFKSVYTQHQAQFQPIQASIIHLRASCGIGEWL